MYTHTETHTHTPTSWPDLVSRPQTASSCFIPEVLVPDSTSEAIWESLKMLMLDFPFYDSDLVDLGWSLFVLSRWFWYAAMIEKKYWSRKVFLASGLTQIFCKFVVGRQNNGWLNVQLWILKLVNGKLLHTAKGTLQMWSS